jgi:hypothetical protein
MFKDKRIMTNNTITLPPPPGMPAPVPVHQFRLKYCCDWYDGHPDPIDKGAYETRTLYSIPGIAASPEVPK